MTHKFISVSEDHNFFLFLGGGGGNEIDIICFNVRCFSFKMHIAFSIAYITHLLVVYVKFLKFFFIDFKISTDEINNKPGY